MSEKRKKKMWGPNSRNERPFIVDKVYAAGPPATLSPCRLPWANSNRQGMRRVLIQLSVAKLIVEHSTLWFV